MFSFYFSAYGRITRKEFWLKYILVIFGVSIAAGAADYVLFPQSREAENGPIGTVVGLVFLWPQIALTTKRFHDRDMTGWWQLVFNLAIGFSVYFAYSALLELEASDYEMTDNLWAPLLGGAGVFVVAGLAELVILGFLPGTKGKNRYGDDPLAPPTRAVADVFS